MGGIARDRGDGGSGGDADNCSGGDGGCCSPSGTDGDSASGSDNGTGGPTRRRRPLLRSSSLCTVPALFLPTSTVVPITDVADNEICHERPYQPCLICHSVIPAPITSRRQQETATSSTQLSRKRIGLIMPELADANSKTVEAGTPQPSYRRGGN